MAENTEAGHQCRPRGLISISDLSREEILRLLESAEAFRARRGRRGGHGRPLEGKSLAMIFEKPSTRTRISMEVAAAELGGHPIYLSAGELQLGRGETVADTARVLSRYVHGITARVYSHSTVVQLAASATVPVVNALSDWEHPLQILADLLTLRQRLGRLEGLRVAWIGDGNNVCNSLILASAILRMQMAVASPPGYQPKAEILEQAERLGAGRRWLLSRLQPQRAQMCLSPTHGSPWETRQRRRRGCGSSGATRSTPSCWAWPAGGPSPCTACQPTGGRRSQTRLWTGRSRLSSTRRRTGCTQARLSSPG